MNQAYRILLVVGLLSGVIIVGSVFLLSSVGILAALILPAIYIAVIYGYIMPWVLENRNRKNRKEVHTDASALRVFLVPLFMGVIYSVTSFFLQLFLQDVDISRSALVLTLFITGAVMFWDYYFNGRLERESLARKKKRDQEYIESLGKAEDKCQSCMKTIGEDTTQCPHCGFE